MIHAENINTWSTWHDQLPKSVSVLYVNASLLLENKAIYF